MSAQDNNDGVKKAAKKSKKQTSASSTSDLPPVFNNKPNRWLRYGAGALVALFIFTLGVNVGNGQISFGQTGGSTGLPASLNYASVNEVYNALKANYDGKLTESQVLDGIKKGLAESTNDPYTEYFNAKDAEALNKELDGSFSGIGAQLGQDSDKNLEVIAPIDGAPAAKAGLKAHDIITSIDNESTSGMSVDTAVSKIRGKKGSTVTLQVLRDKTQNLTFAITRDDITVPSVTSTILDGNIGYMTISQFTENTSDLATKAAQDFKDKNVKGVILDLRDNPGGLLDAAVDVSSLWLPQGQTVLQEKRGSTVVDTYKASGTDILKGIPTTVLINGGSASASEITAGALHDNGAAQLIGEKSYGKGVVQQIVNLSGGAELKVTIASWYRPNGQNINKKGINPDQEVKLSDDDAKAGNDTQKAAAIDYINSKTQ